MELDIELQGQAEEVAAARAEVKEELASIGLADQRVAAAGGMRWGTLACYCNGAATKRTLNKQLLVENGCPAEVVAASYKDSKPYLDLRVVDLSKPKKWHGDGDDDD
jgi:hypothetical protein